MNLMMIQDNIKNRWPYTNELTVEVWYLYFQKGILHQLVDLFALPEVVLIAQIIEVRGNPKGSLFIIFLFLS